MTSIKARLQRPASLGRLVGLAAIVLVLAAIAPPVAAASSGGSLAITTTGLPGGQKPSLVLTGASVHRLISSQHLSLRRLRPGRYQLTVRPLVIKQAGHGVRSGATALPLKRSVSVVVKAGQTAQLVGAYGSIINPGVRRLPGGFLAVVGSAEDPTALLYGAHGSAPGVGTILTSGPTALLPVGLIAKVTKASRQHGRLTISVVSVPVTDAVPELAFVGSLQLKPAHGAAEEGGEAVPAETASVRAHAASGCGISASSHLLQFGAHLDSVELREAFVGAWPPQLKLTLAVRTKETLGLGLISTGLDCSFTLAEIGPFDAAVPVGPLLIPVYATLPLKVKLSLTGSAQAGSINVASTTVAHVAAGFDEQAASLTEQGSHVWSTGPSVSGSAKLTATIGVRAGIGIAKAANLHVEAAFGPEFDASTGHGCDLHLDLGSLSAGTEIFGRSLDTPSFTPFRIPLWSGCKPTGGGGGPGGGGGAPPVDASPPVIKDLSEPPKIGEVLYAAPGTWLGAVTYYNYQWERCSHPGSCSPIPGAASAYYQTITSDLHDTIRVAVSAGNSAGASIPAVSAETEEVIEGLCKPASAPAEGTVYGWGYNKRYELGDGDAVSSSLPVESCISGIREVAAASDDIYALGSNGLVYGWGPSCSGSILATSTDGLSPGVVLGLTNIKQIATESASAGYALSNDGKVYSWGTNELGQLGDGTTTSRWAPEQVLGLPAISQIYAGAGTAFAVAEDGAVYMWGEVPGAMASEHDLTPTLIPGLDEVKRIAAGGGAFFFLHDDGTVESWGSNQWGLLGIGSPNPLFASTRQPVPGLSNVVSLAAGSLAAFAVESNGDVYSWGFNGRDSLGREMPETWSYAPELISGLPPITEVAAGGLYGGYALSESGTVYAWGWNESGQLGDGTTEESALPVKVQGLSDVTAITASINDGIAIVGLAK